MPFGPDDQDRFFGRDGEVPELVSLVVSHRVVVLHATSGAGKTSLVNAALIPHLSADENFDVLPTARVRAAIPPTDIPNGRGNAYTLGLLANWGVDIDPTRESTEAPPDEAGADGSPTPSPIARFLSARPRVTGRDGLPRPRAVIIDQFEEVFTAYPEHWDHRAPFFRELAGLVDADPYLRLIFVVREDYLGNLEPFSMLFPGELGYRFRLERLNAAAAVDAVRGPVRGSPHRFGPGVAERLVDDLRTFHHVEDDGNLRAIVGEFAEPVQLQVVCHNLWKRLPPDTTEINDEHLETIGDVDQMLGEFYDGCVLSAAAVARSDVGAIRKAIQDAFITSGGTRATVYRAKTSTAGIPNSAVDELERMHLIRPEWRANGRWYELTHDRLIDPIRRSNGTYAATVARRRRRSRAVVAAAALLLLGALIGLGLTQLGPGSTPTTVFSVAPSALTFDTTVVGADSDPQGITVTAGDEPVTIVHTRVTSLDFRKASGCSGRVEPGHTCVVPVVFSPHKPGPDRATLVLVMSNGSSESVEMTGLAVTNHIKIMPRSVDFGPVAMGTRSRLMPVTVRNAGTTDVPLDIGGYADFGRRRPLGFDIQVRTCPATLRAKGTCTLHVRFRPTRTGRVSTVAVILAGRDPLAFTVSGVGVPPPPA